MKTETRGRKKRAYSLEKPKNQTPLHYFVLNILSDLINHNGKKYCFPSRQYICKVLKERYNYQVSINRITQICSFLNDSGQIIRKQRPYKSKDENGKNTVRYSSNLFWIKKTGWKLLNKFKNSVFGIPWKKLNQKRQHNWTEQESRFGKQKFEHMGPILDRFLRKPGFEPSG